MRFFYNGYNDEENHAKHMHFEEEEAKDSSNPVNKLWQMVSDFVLFKQHDVFLQKKIADKLQERVRKRAKGSMNNTTSNLAGKRRLDP